MADPSTPIYDKPHEGAAHRELRTRERAYQLWEAEGRLEGRTNHYWNCAKELIEDESKSAYPPEQSRGNQD